MTSPAGAASRPPVETVSVVRHVLESNDERAARNRAVLDAAGVRALNLMASPGAGKTSVILATAAQLRARGLRPGVIEGDLATRIDADRIAAAGYPVVQINTDGGCHLDAVMIDGALSDLPLGEIDLLFIENVGNLVCPANFALGAHANVVIASVPEGHDKPYKYPGIYSGADAVVLNKADLTELLEFDTAAFEQGVRLVNRHAPVFVLSCRTGAGMDAWVAWLAGQQAGHGPA
jgi:hydrogenase nickel incorporation protein HypB